MNRDYKDILIKKFEKFDDQIDFLKKDDLKFEVLNILGELSDPDAHDYYIWGLTFYMADNEGNINLALEKFLLSHQLKSDDFLVCLYIGHCYQDKGEFKNALNFYEQVDKDDLKKFQIWRYVKWLEQIGFCHHKLGNMEFARTRFQEVLHWYKKLPMDETAVPSEMLECLSESDEIVIELKKIEDYLSR